MSVELDGIEPSDFMLDLCDIIFPLDSTSLVIGKTAWIGNSLICAINFDKAPNRMGVTLGNYSYKVLYIPNKKLYSFTIWSNKSKNEPRIKIGVSDSVIEFGTYHLCNVYSFAFKKLLDQMGVYYEETIAQHRSGAISWVKVGNEQEEHVLRAIEDFFSFVVREFKTGNERGKKTEIVPFRVRRVEYGKQKKQGVAS